MKKFKHIHLANDHLSWIILAFFGVLNLYFYFLSSKYQFSKILSHFKNLYLVRFILHAHILAVLIFIPPGKLLTAILIEQLLESRFSWVSVMLDIEINRFRLIEPNELSTIVWLANGTPVKKISTESVGTPHSW